jgi:hypothetical protein
LADRSPSLGQDTFWRVLVIGRLKLPWTLSVVRVMSRAVATPERTVLESSPLLLTPTLRVVCRPPAGSWNRLPFSTSSAVAAVETEWAVSAATVL